MKQDYAKMRNALRQWLIGKDFHIALAALELGMKWHTGLRKDKVTPEFQHQVSQAMYCRTLAPSLMHPEETIATILLHDIVEDCEITHAEVLDYLRSKGATPQQLALISSGIEKMTNQYEDGFTNGEKSQKKEKKVYYQAMIKCPIASICKGIDRWHNHQSMIGVFDKEKQKSYIEETEVYIIEMLKAARKEWTRQESAYTNIKLVLQVQMEFVTELTS